MYYKKLFIIVIALTLLFVLYACSSEEPKQLEENVVYDDFALFHEIGQNGKLYTVRGVVLFTTETQTILSDGKYVLGIYSPYLESIEVGDLLEVTGHYDYYWGQWQLSMIEEVQVISKDSEIDYITFEASIEDLTKNPFDRMNHAKVYNFKTVVHDGYLINQNCPVRECLLKYNQQIIEELAYYEGYVITLKGFYFGNYQNDEMEFIPLDYKVELQKPIIEKADIAYNVGEEIDLYAGLSAFDIIDGNISKEIKVINGEVNNNTAGEYLIEYSVTNSSGLKIHFERYIIITIETLTVNFRYASAEVKNELFEAMEVYLLEAIYGEIPMFSNDRFLLYSDRLSLPVEDYLPIMGYAPELSTMTEDDEGLTIGGRDGVAGEYTYRTALDQNPLTFNQWTYDDETSSDVLRYIMDSLYYFDIHENKVLPSMAASFPVPVDLDAYVWNVPVRENLEWKFHPDTLTEFPDLETDIVAQDFIDTYKMALDEGWFRAVSGAGDFTTGIQEIVNAQAYADGEVEWDEVGLRLSDDGDLEFEFVGYMEEKSVVNWLSSFFMTPIHMGLYEEIGDQYGTSADTTAYNGPFYLDYYEPDRELRLKENDNFHSPDRYSIAGVYFQVIEEATIRLQEYLAGNLDSVSFTRKSNDDFHQEFMESIDTSTANIDITIPDPVTGEMIDVTWSFDAIQRALVGEVQIVDGQVYTE